MNFEKISFIDNPNIAISKGSVGLKTQLQGIATTVSALAIATGGMNGGSLLVRNKEHK